MWIITKFRLKLKKLGKTTRPFRYDWNQIPYDYTVEVTNRSKGLDVIECLKNYGWRVVTLYRRLGSRSSPRKKCKKAKWLSEEALQIAVKRREAKGKGDDGRQRWWNSSWAISNPKRWCCESAAINMPANLENSAVATGLGKVNFYSNHTARQCQRMLKLMHNCTHLTH